MNPAQYIQRVEGPRNFSRSGRGQNQNKIPRGQFMYPPVPAVYLAPNMVQVNPYASYGVYAPMPYYQVVPNYPNYPPQFSVPMAYGFHNFAHSNRRPASPASPRPARVDHMEVLSEEIGQLGLRGIPEGPSGPAEIDKFKSLDVHMGFEELYENIMEYLANAPTCRISWLNRLLAKSNTAIEFGKALNAFIAFQGKNVDPVQETGTLLIKAACRAGVPEKVLGLLKDVHGVRIWPTLGGIHYLMINFSLRKDTQAVIDAFHVIAIRDLKPATRTFHILIRECVDNNLIEEAMKYTEECIKSKVVPNRVTFNILMNGYRKFNKPEEILKLREQMTAHKIEINDTTIKFTALAHMSLGNTDAAVDSFFEFKGTEMKDQEFCDKFFEVAPEDNTQKKCVVDLFKALDQKGFVAPDSVKLKIAALESELAGSE